jgi:hypothetical protein
MDINETKLELVQIILKTEEVELLEQVKQILSPTGEDWWNLISEEERISIEEGLAQANQGETVPHEKVMESIRARFKK